MRLPRVTIRRLLLLVAAMALVLGILVALQSRSERFRGRAAEYASAIHTVYFADVNGKDGCRERCEDEPAAAILDSVQRTSRGHRSGGRRRVPGLGGELGEKADDRGGRSEGVRRVRALRPRICQGSVPAGARTVGTPAGRNGNDPFPNKHRLF